jgi:hypothetical protein
VQGKLGPRMADLGPLMDPTRYNKQNNNMTITTITITITITITKLDWPILQ